VANHDFGKLRELHLLLLKDHGYSGYDDHHQKDDDAEGEDAHEDGVGEGGVELGAELGLVFLQVGEAHEDLFERCR
jgi:hypothetical protein